MFKNLPPKTLCDITIKHPQIVKSMNYNATAYDIQY